MNEVTGLKAGIKWPNDIVINGKKLTGILTEMSAETDCVNYVVVGIGINANMTEFTEDIRATATSLMKDGNLAGLKAEYEAESVNMNRQVAVITSGGELIRKAVGINDEGEVLVEDDEGNVTSVRSGEVSVRGIYGYV